MGTQSLMVVPQAGLVRAVFETLWTTLGVAVLCAVTFGALPSYAQGRADGLSVLESVLTASAENDTEVRVVTVSAHDLRTIYRRIRPGRPNLTMRRLHGGCFIPRENWRPSTPEAFATVQRICRLARSRADRPLRVYRFRWGTDDDDFRNEGVGIAIVERERVLLVESMWSWFER